MKPATIGCFRTIIGGLLCDSGSSAYNGMFSEISHLNLIFLYYVLTHWGRVTHICVGKLTNIGSDNGVSPGRRQAIIWTNARIVLFGPLGANISEFLVVIHTFSFNKMHLKMSSAKWRPNKNYLYGRLSSGHFLASICVYVSSVLWIPNGISYHRLNQHHQFLRIQDK